MQKDIKVSLILCGVAIVLLVLFGVLQNNNDASIEASNSAVRIENEVQVIDIIAKGGYSPLYVEAMSGVQTEIRVSTNSTYDCSSSLIIPELGYQKTLKPTGTEIISLSIAQAQGTIEGMCAMGMYKFEIVFN